MDLFAVTMGEAFARHLTETLTLVIAITGKKKYSYDVTGLPLNVITAAVESINAAHDPLTPYKARIVHPTKTTTAVLLRKTR